VNLVMDILYSKAYKWPYLVLFSITTLLLLYLHHLSDFGFESVLAVLGALVDWIGVFAFVRRKAVWIRGFWQVWLFWSILWFLVDDGPGLLRGLAYYDPFSLITVAVTALYYLTFLLMLYSYAFLDNKVWGRSATE